MKYLLDTNTCIRSLNHRSPAVATRLAALPRSAVCTCAVVKAELFFGAYRSQNPARTLAAQRAFLAPLTSPPFDDVAADHYDQIRATLAAQGTLIGPNDLLIAAIARANGITLVTHNTREFSRVPDLMIEDWETDDNALV